MSADEQTYRNLSLSFRGSERQAPNILQLALRFSKVIERSGASSSGNTDARLRKAVQAFNSSPGLHVKHQIPDEKERAIYNMIAGSCKAGYSAIMIHAYQLQILSFDCCANILSKPTLLQEAREVMSQHLSFVKWKDCAFATEHFKSLRWLIGARPKNVPDSFAEVLTVGPIAQTMLMELHVHSFTEATRRVKLSARARLRCSVEDFEKLVDYACLFAALRAAAKTASSDKSVDEKLLRAFMAKILVEIQCWKSIHYPTSLY